MKSIKHQKKNFPFDNLGTQSRPQEMNDTIEEITKNILGYCCVRMQLTEGNIISNFIPIK